ncbi:TetR family transcriptional regulator [Paenibacillus turpanensis]|uniref:TetR family transcriptional regulator n=1 Tax=Paenibacillus turpanensis TaxID=2689078 RepID=UPI00140D2FD2
MARRAVEQELTREIILNVARELFVSKGYRSVSMRNIASALGYSHGSLYYHFKEKAELFYALVQEDFNLLIGKQRMLLAQKQIKGFDLLELMMMEFIKFGLDNPHHYETMFLIRDCELQGYSRSEQAASMDLFSSFVRSVLEGHSREKELKFMLPWNLFMALHGFITFSIHHGQKFHEVEKLAKEHVLLLSRSIQASNEAARVETLRILYA